MKQRTRRMVATAFFSMMALSGAAQYFGIGTATPQVTLDLEGTGANHQIRLRESSGSPTVRLALNSVFGGMPYVGTDNANGFGIVANNLQLITASKNGNVGINTINPHASAIMELESNNRGLLMPRMTSAQRVAITAPARGLLVFDSDVNAFYFFNGTAWAAVTVKSELERITENSKTGYRILNRLPANYGDIGQDAVDLSFNATPSSTLGATGSNSFATGLQTTAAGVISTAMGLGTSATGLAATAMGNLSSAAGNYSFAAGNQSVALGISSMAIGQQSAALGNHSAAFCIGDTARGTASFAAGYFAKATGEYAVAMGHTAEASGNYSLALGRGADATGIGATAMGQNTRASGNSATALGQTTLASGTASTAMGNATVAKSYGELTIGAFNDTLLAANSTIFRADTNRLFTVGNGLTVNNRKTAFVIQQDGNVGIGIRRPTSLLHVNGEVGINGSYPLELGADVVGKELNAGKIGYEAFTLGALDMVGAGTATGNRRIKLWAEGGLEVAGTIVQEAVQLPTLLGGWQNYGAGFAPIGYWKDKEGMVHLRGFVGSGNTTGGTVLFNLPTAYRPSGGRLVFTVLSNSGIGRVDIATTGDVTIDNLPANGWLNLTGIYFRTN
jgi:Head domain of trimeric autotransporter adhesin